MARNPPLESNKREGILMVLRKFTLAHDGEKRNWKLAEDGKDRALRRFSTKAEALAGGVLADALGKQGGSVKVEKVKGGYQEERTYPRSKDPKASEG